MALHALPPDDARVTIMLVRRRDAFVSAALARFIETTRRYFAAHAQECARAARKNDRVATAVTGVAPRRRSVAAGRRSGRGVRSRVEGRAG
ncbi:MAG TPA: hypothetical protein VGZ23_00340 [bacterium]|nr:hypothetical protein [bacterium]